jgi:hypothetical protein
MLFIAAFFFACGSINSTETQMLDTTATPQPTLSWIDSVELMAEAFAIQESRCTPDAVSPDGLYVGCLQISKIMVREANRLLGEDLYSYDDRYNPDYSVAMFKVVMEHRNPELSVDRAIELWNEHAPLSYRQNVHHYYDSLMCNAIANL